MKKSVVNVKVINVEDLKKIVGGHQHTISFGKVSAKKVNTCVASFFRNC